MPCLDDNALALLLAGGGSGEERARWATHLDQCSDCRALAGYAARAEPLSAQAPSRGVLAPGTKLGSHRYIVLETIGAGAMGVVYAAYDPELHRRVALKLLRPEPAAAGEPGGDSPARGRLLSHRLPALSRRCEAQNEERPPHHHRAQTIKSMPARAPKVFLVKPEPTAALMFHLPSSDQRETRAAAATCPP